VTGLGTVRVALELGAGPRPPVGVTGTARVDVGPPRPATLVPPAALRTVIGDQGEIVVCGRDGRAHVLRVDRAGSDGSLTAVRPVNHGSAGGGATGGADAAAPALGPGDAVAVDPVLGLGDGDTIDPVMLASPGTPASPVPPALR
jgi:hypothetical protein